MGYFTGAEAAARTYDQKLVELHGGSVGGYNLGCVCCTACSIIEGDPTPCLSNLCCLCSSYAAKTHFHIYSMKAHALKHTPCPTATCPVCDAAPTAKTNFPIQNYLGGGTISNSEQHTAPASGGGSRLA